MKKLSYFISISSVMLLSLQFAFAEKVPVDKAERAAYNFFSSAALTKASLSSVSLVWDGVDTKSSDSPFFIFNVGDEGFVIIAGDDGMDPVLGYSMTCPFHINDIPDGLESLLESYRQSVCELRQGKRIPSPLVSGKWMDLLTPAKSSSGAIPSVDLKTALWGQSAPFYNLCPEYGGKQCLTGCANTALAILMKYYKWPESGYGTVPGYHTESYNISLTSKTLGDKYQWDQMPDYYTSSSTEIQNTAVATIMADMGLINQSDYTPDGTGTSVSALIPGMLTYMKYSNQAILIERVNYSTDEWVNILKGELNSKHPVLYNGFGYRGGHSYIVDGYDSEGRIHFNWGWNGSDNGFFYVSDTEFSSSESAIIGLVPDKSWTAPTSTSALSYYSGQVKISGSLYSVYGIWAETAYFQEGIPAGVYLSVVNNGNEKYSGKLRICQRHADSDVDVVNESEVVEINYGGIWIYYCSVSLPAITDGDELLVYYYDGVDWVPLDGGLKTLPLRYAIPDVISLRYDKNGSDKKLYINAMIGMTVSINGGEPQSFSSKEVSITNPSGVYTFTFSNGHDSHTIHLTF